MSVHVESGEDHITIALTGEHDIATAHQVRRALAEARGAARVVIDLGDCEFVDSTVLGVLATGSRRVAESGGTLVAVNANGIVARALALTGIDGLLGMEQAREV